MLKQFFANRRARRVLGKYVSTQVLDDILSGRSDDASKIKASKIDFIFLLLNDASAPEKLSRQIEEITTLCANKATIDVICGPFVVVVFNMPPIQIAAPTERSALAEKIRLHFGPEIRIVHGAADGHMGMFGGSIRVSYTFTFPGFTNAFAELSNLKPGEFREFKASLAK